MPGCLGAKGHSTWLLKFVNENFSLTWGAHVKTAHSEKCVACVMFVALTIAMHSLLGHYCLQ